ncbi:hypothetical protein [Pseudotabrizicola sp.]|uniref:hypothetical protein n=1 Tax=Pseudotabrizicola sp. TaxID=2939647 RepID=UPI00272F1EBF|nr:hypothetical protein [Pseudotabrizicola sp.]MDP2079509.1 hypothetical protein [Pseudotabrizicola sp.]
MINAKLFSEQTITTVALPDDPTDKQILDALESSGELVLLGERSGWEVYCGSDLPQNQIVIGSSPFLGDFPKRRVDCTLNDEQVLNLLNEVVR